MPFIVLQMQILSNHNLALLAKIMAKIWEATNLAKFSNGQSQLTSQQQFWEPL